MNKTFSIVVLGFFLAYSISSFGQDKASGQQVARGKTFVFRPENKRLPGGARATAASVKDMIDLKKEDDLRLISEKTGKQGFHLQKYQQYNKGIPVEYSTVSVSGRQGNIGSIAGEVYDVPDSLGSNPSIAESTALDAALQYIGASRYKWENAREEAWLRKTRGAGSTYYPQGALVYVSVYLPNGSRQKGEMALAYKFDIYAEEPLSRDHVFVDAHYGEVIHKNPIIMHAEAGQAATRYSGTKTIATAHDVSLNTYVLKDDSRGQGVETYNMNNGTDYALATDFTDTDNHWTQGEFDNIKKDNAALDAHWGAMMTYDYFLTQHGRNSYNDNGAKIVSYVHYSTLFANAFWNGEAMTYGDGNFFTDPLTSLDICAHEIGHAVCRSTANLVYQNESGALNEGLSDIWGATIEHYAAPEKSTWDMGEDIRRIARSMSDPNAYGDPDTYKGDFWHTGTDDNGGVHTNSGVMNHWYYILVTGKSGVNDHGNGYDVQGIGFDAAARIVYRMESVYLTANSQYEDARIAAIHAATDIFGAQSNETIQTRKAWDAVGVYTNAVPSQLIAAAVSAGSINLLWTDNASNETAFVIERSHSRRSGYTPVATVAANTTAYTDTALQPGMYYYRVKAVVDGDHTGPSNTAGTALGLTPLVMAETQVTTCHEVFLDPGGLGRYGNDQIITMVVNPAGAGKKVSVAFAFFKLMEGDHLDIFDGNSVEAAKIGSYTGETLPPHINATNASGTLTFRFSANSSLSSLGWQAELSCVAIPSGLAATVVSDTRVDLSWQDNSSTETGYSIERRAAGNTSFEEIATLPADATGYVDEGLAADNLYLYRVRAQHSESHSTHSGTVTAVTGREPFIMREGSFTVCNAPFLDPGGNGPYFTGSSGITTTLMPETPGARVSVSFSEFDLGNGFDALEVYDGGSTGAPLIGYYEGNTLPPTITASNPEGRLTFYFFYIDQTNRPGWRAHVSCAAPPAAPADLRAEATGPGRIGLTWQDNAGNETGYIIERSTTGNYYITIATLDANTEAYEDTDLREDRQYFYRVRAVLDNTPSDHSNISSVVLGTPPLIMKNGEVSVCNAVFLDAGGDENYGNDNSYTLTIGPDAPGNRVKVTFTVFDVEHDYDYLQIYNGGDTSAPLLGTYDGHTLPPPALATNPDGALTLMFYSDGLQTGTGWEATVSCITSPAAPTGLLAKATSGDVIRLTWQDASSDETGFIVERATGSQYITIATLGANVQAYEDTGYPQNRKLSYRVRSVRDNVLSDPATASVTIGTPPLIMHTGDVATCNSVFLDSGGDEHFGPGSHVMTIGPDQPGKKVAVTFTAIDLAKYFDRLEAYNGAGTDSDLIWEWDPDSPASDLPLTLQALNPDGDLTFRFTTLNNQDRGSGWQATVSCVTKGEPTIIFPDRIEYYSHPDDGDEILLRAYTYASPAHEGFSYSIVDDGSTFGEVQLTENNTGVIVTPLKLGGVKIKAALAETPYTLAAEKTMTLMIRKGLPQINFSPPETAVGAPFELNATVGPDGNMRSGNFTYEVVDNDNFTGEVVLSGPGNKIVTPVKPGTVLLKASLAETRFFVAYSQLAQLNITKGTPVISFSDMETAAGSTPFDLSATAYDGANFAYGIVNENTGEVTLSGDRNKTVTPVKAGTVKLKAYLPETNDYLAAEKSIALTIDRGAQTVTFDEIEDMLTTADPFALTASASSGLPVNYTVTSGPASVSGDVITLTGETGTVTVEASQPGNDNYYPAEPVVRTFSAVDELVLSTGNDPGRLIAAWPNPATAIVHIRSEHYKIAAVSLIDILGRTVVKETSAKPTEEYKLDVNPVHPGMYMLYIKTENGTSAIKRLQIVK